jgi:hypothetical protein
MLADTAAVQPTLGSATLTGVHAVPLTAKGARASTHGGAEGFATYAATLPVPVGVWELAELALVPTSEVGGDAPPT